MNKNEKGPLKSKKVVRRHSSILERLSFCNSTREDLSQSQKSAIQARHAIQRENEAMAAQEAESKRALDIVQRCRVNSLVIEENDLDDLLDDKFIVSYGRGGSALIQRNSFST